MIFVIKINDTESTFNRLAEAIPLIKQLFEDLRVTNATAFAESFLRLMQNGYDRVSLTLDGETIEIKRI